MSSVEEGCWTRTVDLRDSGTMWRGQCGTVSRVMLKLLCRGCCGERGGVGAAVFCCCDEGHSFWMCGVGG